MPLSASEDAANYSVKYSGANQTPPSDSVLTSFIWSFMNVDLVMLNPSAWCSQIRMMWSFTYVYKGGHVGKPGLSSRVKGWGTS